MMLLGRRHEFLEVVDAVDLLRLSEICKRGDKPQALALRPKQRLLHELVPLTDKGCSKRLGLGAARFGEGARRRQSRSFEEKRRGGFVDAVLDGARIVPHHYTKLAQRV